MDLYAAAPARARTGGVFAVIVTYNRQGWLRECLDAVLSQSFPPTAILVVNNASTDDTRQMLETDYADRVTRLHMAHNVGGGGGFYQGMTWAYENGADWLWLMDDDGIPAPNSLAAMMAPANTVAFDVMNPLVVCRDDDTTLSFMIDIEGHGTKSVAAIRAHAAGRKVLADQINPFNGTLISRRTIEKVGYPRWEMFIWGDEVDYIHRLHQSGLRVATILDAIHRHPAEKRSSVDLGVFGSVHIAPPHRIGIATRNLGYFYRTHQQSVRLRVFKPIVIALYYLSQGSLRGCLNAIRYYIDGYFDLYWLPPSRRSLRNRGREFDLRPATGLPTNQLAAELSRRTSLAGPPPGSPKSPPNPLPDLCHDVRQRADAVDRDLDPAARLQAQRAK